MVCFIRVFFHRPFLPGHSGDLRCDLRSEKATRGRPGLVSGIYCFPVDRRPFNLCIPGTGLSKEEDVSK